MKELRDKIDKIDEIIIKKLSQRISTAKQIGLLKIKLNKPVLDKKREAELARMYKRLCAHYKVDKELVSTLFKLIISHSRTVQR